MTTSSGISGLQRLPYELVAYIVQDLDIEDVFHWSLCSKHFQYIIREDHFCKPVVMVSTASDLRRRQRHQKVDHRLTLPPQTKVPGTLEAREAFKTGRFSRALRRLAKRREALSRASPICRGHRRLRGFVWVLRRQAVLHY